LVKGFELMKAELEKKNEAIEKLELSVSELNEQLMEPETMKKEVELSAQERFMNVPSMDTNEGMCDFLRNVEGSVNIRK